MELKKWQNQLLDLITGRYQNYFRNKKVIWVQDMLGIGIEKLPIDRPDRVRSAVIKLSKKK